MLPGPQAFPQLPQWAASLFVLTHSPPQHASLPAHALSHRPQCSESMARLTQSKLQQLSPGPQILSQPPQCFGSLERSKSSSTMPSQSSSCPSQVTSFVPTG